jgi:hypothetical protein
MKFQLDYRVEISDEPVSSAEIPDKIEEHRDELVKIDDLYGEIVLQAMGDAGQDSGAVSEPIIRLTERWLRKLQWVIGGDTETIPCMNSEHCFAFVPAGESVEISLFIGDESEVEEYLVEPVTVRLELLVNESLRLAKALIGLVETIEPSLLESNDGCKELGAVLGEVAQAWREHQQHR